MTSGAELPPEVPPLLRLVAVMDRLRSPGGCAWDARQTHRTLAEYLLEECHETLEAIETGDDEALREELGDLLLQVVFHARIGQEADPAWSIDDVAAGIVAKLIRRHPHVFGDESPHADLAEVGTTDDEVLTRNWSQIKAREQARESALDGIPRTLPALALAQKSWRRAREAGLVVEPDDLPPAVGDEQLGEALLGLVIAAELAGRDAESALRGATRRMAAEARRREA